MIFRLNITYEDHRLQKTFNIKDTDLVKDVCTAASENIPENDTRKYGLFLPDKAEPNKGLWLEPSRHIGYYQMITQDTTLQFKKKFIIVAIRTLDGTRKKVELDESKTVGELMLEICSKMGIVNFEEYSLVRDSPLYDDRTGTMAKTGTMSRGATSSNYDRPDSVSGASTLSKDSKMEHLRKKLKTDDTIYWLNHAQTLREQGLYKDLDLQPLVLRRKFFLSDRNVDTRDPVQLTLLYAQCVDGITSGRYPVTQKEATMLAGLQLYIERGVDVKGEITEQINWDEFLPKEYKGKGLEREIYERYKELGEIVQADARLKYVQTCRQLRTYGIAIFLAKEKHEEKRKLRPVLLGITRDAVVRIKPKNREVLQEWPLTKIKQWEVRTNVFTLDFGEYGRPYSVQTQEGEQIARLLAGYADIISKKKQGVEYSPTSTLNREPHAPTFENIQPQRATILTPGELAATLRRLRPSGPPADGNNNGEANGTLRVSQNDQLEAPGTPSSVDIEPPPPTPSSPAHQALASTFNSGMAIMDEAQRFLTDAENIRPHPPATDAADLARRQAMISSHRQNVAGRLSEMSAATASIMTTTFTAASDGQAPDEHHCVNVAHAVNTISREMPPLCEDVRGLVLFSYDSDDNPDNRGNLLAAARRLAAAFNDMFRAAHPTNVEPRQQLLTAATRVGEAADVLKAASGVPVGPDEKSYQERLLALAKAVANATAQLVLRAKAVANRCETVANQNSVIQAATQCALATSQLVAVTKVVIASAAESVGCQTQLANVGAQVSASVDKLADMAPRLCPEERMVAEMSQAANQVSVCLQEFLGHVHGSAQQKQEQQLPVQQQAQPQTFEDLQSAVIKASERIISQAHAENGSGGDSRETARCAGGLAQSASQLIVALRGIVAEESDDSQKQRLLNAARQLAEATTRLVANAKSYAEQQNVQESRQQIIEKAGQIREMVLQLSAEPVSNLTPEEQALDDAIADGLDQFGAANRRLAEPLSLIKESEQREAAYWSAIKSATLTQLTGRVSAMSAAAAQAVSASAVANANIAGVADVSSPAVVECAVVTDAVVAIAMHAQPLAEDARNFAAVQESEEGRDSVISATQTLTNSFNDFFLAARPLGIDGGTSSTPDERRQKLWAAASVVGQASGELVVTVNGPVVDEERAFQEQVLNLARAVSSATAKLVLAAKSASSRCDSDVSKNAIIQSATQSALAASQLVAVTRVVLPSLMSDQRCREQLARSCGAVGIVADRLVSTTERECNDEQSVTNIQDAAGLVGKSVTDLVRHISGAGVPKPPPHTQTSTVTTNGVSNGTHEASPPKPSPPPPPQEKETVTIQIEQQPQPVVVSKPRPPPPPPKKPTPTSAVIAASERVIHADDSNEVAAEANILAHMTSLLISAIKDKANGETDEAQKGRLLAAAKQLADATAKMLEAASIAPAAQAASPTTFQETVKQSAEQIRAIAVSAGIVHSVERGGSEKVVIAPRVQEFKPSNTPAIEECTIAVSRLQLLRSELSQGQIAIPQSNQDASVSLQQAMNDARVLGDAVAQVSVHAKDCNVSNFVEAVRQFSGSLAGLSLNSLQTFTTASDQQSPTSSPTALGPAAMGSSIDSLVSARALIQEACVPLSALTDPVPSHDELVNVASRVARQTKLICDTCKTAVGRSSDVIVRRRYVELAKEVATATTQLVQAIKDQQPELGPPDIVKLNNAAAPLLTSVDSLVEFVRSAAITQPENPEKRQQEFVASLVSTLDVGCTMLDTAKALISQTDPADTTAYQAYSTQSSQLSACIKNVLSTLRSENFEQPQQQSQPTSNVQSPAPSTPVQKNEAQQPSSQPRPPPPPPRPANLAAIMAATNAAAAMAASSEEDATERLVQTAERELMTAAKQILAVSRRLNEMQEHANRQSEAFGGSDEIPTSTLHYHEQIIEACRALANVTQALVRSASEAQRELMAQGRMIPAGRQQLYAADDSQWSQGLISAARLVADATQNLCESADQLLRGTGSEEKVIAAARQVASCTTQLVLACRVKADPNSATYNRLQAAGQSVKAATESLVATVQRLISGSNSADEGSAEDLLGRTRVGGLTQIINMHEEVMRRERELEEARRRLAKIYKGQYNRTGNGNFDGASGGPAGGSYLPSDFDSSGGSGALTGF